MVDPSGVAAEMRANFEEKTETSPSAPPRSRRGIRAIPNTKPPHPRSATLSPSGQRKTKRGAFPIHLLPAGERPRCGVPAAVLGEKSKTRVDGRSRLKYQPIIGVAREG